MRGRRKAVVVLAITTSLLVMPVVAEASPRCDATPIRTALDALERLGAGIAVTVRSPRCGVRGYGVGLADRWTGRAVVGDEHSRIGSNTKAWTATVVLQLVGEGRIRLDETVDHYLPGLIRTKRYDARTFTVRQMLQHTNGLPDYLEAPFWQNKERRRWDHTEPVQTVRMALTLPPPVRWGTAGFAYANTNYNLAGLLVTKVTGRDIGTEINQRIIRRLGLRDTYWPGDRVTIPYPELRSYPRQSGLSGDRTEWNTSEANASGSLISTGADVTAFWTALLTGRLLAPAQLAEMKRTVPDQLSDGYGLGIERTRLTPDLITWGHSGSMPSGHKFRNAVTEDGRRSVTLLIGTDQLDSAEIDAIMGRLVRDLR
ncbi:serine hydrolase domain-containing protein [Crossiella cryophila]|uniref:D-alanyl-D-alanine carboxypeptidase n=1 Tax=Crossiella cryophila TaxID=43355 RepID=A0A7W7CC94_9PSEU|nr:serine hydrolase domain-containing protein [Crossiella cryophila]MBB4678535.1 D-alanyl-D-alanine carboxypeptidase [Crossiella cryophila]